MDKRYIYESLDSLIPIQNVINEVAIALEDPERIAVNSAISDALGAVSGTALGAGAGFTALYYGGVTGLSAPGITSGLAAAGAVVGGGMAAGIAVLAAPALILGVGGYVLVHRKRERKLKEEKDRLYTEALRKQQAMINELKKKAQLSKERADYLERLNILLQKAIEDLKQDLGKAA